MPVEIYPSAAKIKRNGVYQNLPAFVAETDDNAAQQMIATAESSNVAQYRHEVGSYFRLNNVLYETTNTINIGDNIVVGTNCKVAVLANKVSLLEKNNKELENEINELTYPKNDVNGTRYNVIYSSAQPINLVDKTRLKHGYYINNGNIIASAVWNITDKIFVNPSETIYISQMNITCFFDADGTFISQVTNVTSATIPANTSYLISCVLDQFVATCYITYRDPMVSRIVGDGILKDFKKDYEAGFIPFTVPVRQTKSNNAVASSERSEGTEDYVNVDCILSLPRNYNAVGKPVKLLMMCHGAGQGVNSWKEKSGYQAIVNIFLSRGYAVFDCNGFKNDALGWSFWGDPRGVECWYKAYQYVVDNYNVEHEFAVYGFSMGGLTAMNLALNGFPNIKCIALGSPVLSLKACYYDSGVSAVIKTLYGMGDLYDVAKAYGSDPYAHIKTLYDNRTVSLFEGNSSHVTSGYYINPNTGVLSSGEDWNVTDFIDANAGDTLTISGMGITAFYKSDGTFISYVQNVTSTTVPNGAKYIRSCVINTYLSTSFIKRTSSAITILPYNLPPLKIWFGSTETADAETDTGTDLTVSGAVDKTIAIDFVNAINNAGGKAEYREVEGAGHEICYGMNNTCNVDYLLYAERYCKWNPNNMD